MPTHSVPSTLDTVGSADAAGAEAGHRGFDACHPALALRALLLVQSALLLAALAVAGGWHHALTLLGPAVMGGLGGTLLWLAAVCALQGRLVRLPPSRRGSLLTVLGALAAVCGWLPLLWLKLADPLPSRLVALPLIGAALAAVAWAWLEARARTQFPADAIARLAQLQSRIRPHFLFNALNTALALVQVDPPRAERVLEDLAALFRVALADQNAAVALEDEIELARRYLAIEQIRFGSRLQLTWELDAGAGAAMVPPLVLQPLVENAVRHGIEPSRGGGVIRVATQVRRAQAVIRIDNTLGDTPSTPGNGMALANVRERLRLLHDVAATFDVKRDAGWFRVQIVVPL
jgi:two-component system sensor histidine kinase AlgZ